jgi:hypothetical protein
MGLERNLVKERVERVRIELYARCAVSRSPSLMNASRQIGNGSMTEPLLCSAAAGSNNPT